jgi:hypothetical protein
MTIKLCFSFKFFLCIGILINLTCENLQFSSNVKTCNPIICPFNQGICIENICKCSPGFTTNGIYNNQTSQISQTTFSNTETFCNYRQLCAYTAFFLEFLFPIGAGHIYAKNFKLAILKFFSFSIFFCFICGEFFLFRVKLSILSKCDRIIAYFLISDIFIWFIFHLVDLAFYGAGIYRDGNGIELLR